jgi:hypothetical protein
MQKIEGEMEDMMVALESRLACESDHVQRSYHRAHRTEWLWNTQAGLPTRSHTAPYQSRMGHPE